MPSALNFFGRRMPVIIQTEASECGLACLAMIASYHGHETDLPSLRQRFVLSSRGTTLAQIMKCAEGLAMNARPLRLELEGLACVKLPAVLHWDFSHFVVLHDVDGDVMTVHDPASGRRVMSKGEFSRHFTGVALELSPAADFEAKDERRGINLRKLIGRIPRASRSFAQIFLLCVAIEIFTLLSPLFMQVVIDQVIVTANSDLLSVLAAGFLLVALLHTTLTALRGWAVLHVGAHLNLQLQTGLFAHILRLPMAYFERRHIGDLVSRFLSLDVIQRTLTASFIEALVDGLMLVATLAMMAIYSPLLTCVVLAAAFAYALTRWALYPPFRSAADLQLSNAARQSTQLIETLRGIQAIKLFGAQDRRQVIWQNAVVSTMNADVRGQQLGLAYRAAHGLIFGVENVAVVWLGASAILGGRLSVGMLFAFITYKLLFVARLNTLVDKGIEYRMLDLHAERLADMALADAEGGAGAGQAAPAEAGTIEARNLGFRYTPDEPWIFRGVNFAIEPGEVVALVGPSGCGKTTLIKVLLGLLPPTEGEVIVNEVGMGPRERVAFRAIVGAVMQDDHLFAGSLAENIAFFDPQVDMARVERCCRLAFIHDDIARLPMGYNTPVTNMGSSLSGGQRQRLFIARALYRDPKILVLDEATSELDVRREREVNGSVRRLGVTAIVSAHRPETISSADRVIELAMLA